MEKIWQFIKESECTSNIDIQTILHLETTQLNSIPKITTTCCKDGQVLSIDNFLAVALEDDYCCLNLREKISDIVILDGGYIAIAEKSGILTLGIIKDQLHVKQSVNFASEKSEDEASVFLKIQFQSYEEASKKFARLVCLCSSGKILIFHNILLLNKDLDLSMVKMEKISPAHVKINDFTVTETSLATVGTGTDCLAVYDFCDCKCVLSQAASLDSADVELERICTNTLSQVWITMNSAGSIDIWDNLTLCVIYSWFAGDIQDFRILELNVERNFSLENIQMLSQVDDLLTLFNPSEGTVVKEIKTGAEKVCLGKWPVHSDDIYVAVCLLDRDDDRRASVCLRNYADTSPHKRVEYLLARRRFDEAELLTQQFGLKLALEPVHIQQRLNQPKATFDETWKHIAKCRAQLLQKDIQDNTVKQILENIEYLKMRLEAFGQIFGENSFSAEDWEDFQNREALDLFEHLLQTETEKAFVLWQCFEHELKQELKPGMIAAFLDKVPSCVSHHAISQWIYGYIIPNFIVMDPGAVMAIIHWVKGQVRHLEESKMKTWTSEPINLCQRILESFESAVKCDPDDFDPKNLMAYKVKVSCHASLSPLKELLELLHWQDDLWNKYRYQISLQELEKESKESVVYRMLDRIMIVDLQPQNLEKQVLPYIQHHNFVADQLYANYVQILLERCTSGTLNSAVTEKMKAFIRLIVSPKEKITAMLKLLKSVTYPLPEFVKELAEEILNSSQHFLVSELRETWKQAECNDILISYEVEPISVKSTLHVMDVARHIIAEGGPLSHVEKLLSANNISESKIVELQCFQCQLFVERNQIDQMRKYIRGLPSTSARRCCLHIISLAKAFMPDRDSFLVQATDGIRMQFYEASELAAAILLTLTDNEFEKGDISRQVATVKKVKTLELTYKLLVNQDVLEDVAKGLQILDDQLDKLKYEEIFHFASLLNIQDGIALRRLLIKEASYFTSPSIQRFLIKLSEFIMETLPSTFLQSFPKFLSLADASWPIICHKLCQFCLTYSPAELFNEVQEMCSLSAILIHVFSQQKLLKGDNPAGLYPEEFYSDSKSLAAADTVIDEVLESFELIAENKPLDALEKISMLVQSLKKSGQHQIALHILIAVTFSRRMSSFIFGPSSESQNRATKLTEAIRSTASKLSSQILERRVIDPNLSLASLLALSKSQAVSLLRSAIEACGNEFGKMKRLAAVATAVSEVYEDVGLIEECHTAQLAAKWGLRLSKIKIPFGYGQVSLLTASTDALKKLVRSPYCEVNILIEFFRDMNLEFSLLEDCLMEMLNICLLTNEQSSPAALRKAKSILSRMSVQKLKALKNIKNKINSYNYEALELILTEILALEADEEASRGLDLIRYLKFYNRCAAPADVELQHWTKDCGDVSAILPEISSIRLPYHLLMSVGDRGIIRAEMKPHTLTYWLNMAPVLKISKDAVIFNTVSSLIQDYLQSQVASHAAEVSPDFQEVALQVDNLLSKAEDVSYPVGVCWPVIDKLRSSGERALICQVALRYAQKWLAFAHESGKKDDEKLAQDNINKFTSELKRSSMQWALCKVGLQADESLKSLVKRRKPEELIQQLYLHPTILEKFGHKDINAACDEIACAYDLDIVAIRQSLLDKWTLGSFSSGDFDQTMTFGNVCDASNEKEDLQRALYLLGSRDREVCLKYLNDALYTKCVAPDSEKRILYCLLKCGVDVPSSVV